MTNDMNIKSELLVVGYKVDSDFITKSLGLEPTKVICKGETLRTDQNGKLPPLLQKENLWIYQSDLPTASNIEEHLAAMVDKIFPKKDFIRHLSSECTVEISIYGETYDIQVGVHLDVSLLNSLKDLNVEVDISIYPADKEYLATKEQVGRLKLRLIDLGIHEDEATAITDALRITEKEISNVTGAAINNLTWDELSKKDVTRRLGLIGKGLKSISEAASRSSVLSKSDQLD